MIARLVQGNTRVNISNDSKMIITDWRGLLLSVRVHHGRRVLPSADDEVLDAAAKERSREADGDVFFLPRPRHQLVGDVREEVYGQSVRRRSLDAVLADGVSRRSRKGCGDQGVREKKRPQPAEDGTVFGMRMQGSSGRCDGAVGISRVEPRRISSSRAPSANDDIPEGPQQGVARLGFNEDGHTTKSDYSTPSRQGLLAQTLCRPSQPLGICRDERWGASAEIKTV